MATRWSSGPAASKLLTKMRAELDRGWPPGLTLLTGDDLFHLDAAQKMLLDALVPAEATDFAISVFGDERVDVGTVVAAARSLGMFSERRVVLLRDIASLEGEPDALKEYAARPPQDSYLIVRAPELDQRFKLHKTLARAGKTLKFSAAQPGSSHLVADLRGLADDRGLQLDRTAAEFLAEATAGDLHRAASELDKIDAFFGAARRRRVTAEVLREVGAGGGLLSGWEVANGVMMRDRAEALAAVGRLVESGDEPIRLVGGLAWRARVMLQARVMIEAGASMDAVTKVGRCGPEAARALRRYSVAELRRFPALLLEADRSLKSRSLAPRAVLENLVDAMTRRPDSLQATRTGKG
jgi:DNA polymerase-3 subunit delta